MSVPQGTWDIVFTPPSPLQPATRSNYSVTGNQTLDVVLIQEGVSTFSGRLVDHAGTPVGYAYASLYDPTYGYYYAQAGADGRFTVYARNGNYRLGVSGDGNPIADVPRGSWQLFTANQAYTLTANTDVGDLALPTPVRLDVTVIDPASQPVANARVYPEVSNPAAIPGFSTLLGLPISFGNSYLDQQYTGSNGSVAGTVLWPSSGIKLHVNPPSTQPNLLPTTTPSIPLATSVDLLVAYQTNGSVSLISGAADRYTTQAATMLSVPAPGVLGNDVNYGGGTLQAVLVQGPSHGTLQLNADGSLQYQPNAGFTGNDTFTYRATANGLQSNPILVTISVADQIPPVVTGHADRDPAPYPWFNAPVIVTWTAIDPAPSSGAPTTPGPIIVSTDGANQVITSGQSCDPAGNCATGQYTVSIDQVVPTITHTVTPAANGAGWRNSDVTVTFTCADGLSGIATCPAPVTITADGSGQTVTGTAIDNAGNTATTTATVNLDKTKPQIGYTLSSPANGNGWHNSDVTVTFTCTDATSGIATCPAPVTVDAGTPGQTVSGTAFDNAGNSDSTSVTIKLDIAAPDIDYTLAPAANADGWNNTDVIVTFSCSDSLSGIAVCPAPVTLTSHGAAQTVTGTAVDNAGNTATTTATVNIDKIAPQIGYTVTPDANGGGWHNASATVTFACADDLSGIAYCPPPVIVDTDTAGQTVSGTAYDKAGNSTTVNIVVKLDKSAPTMTGTPYPTSNTQGWNNTDVAIFFSCGDALSGIASCSSSLVLTTEGANQSVTGQAVDNAGNSAATTLTISIDKTAPTLGSPTWTDNPKPVDVPSSPVNSTVSIPATDTLSGVLRGEYFIGTDPGAGSGFSMPLSAGNLTATLGAGLPVGVYDIGIRALDKAGNWSTVTTTMLVIYDPAAPSITGRNNNNLIPSLAAGDILPGLTSPTQTDTADYGFTVEYRGGSLDPNNDFHFVYATGTHCHTPNPSNCHKLSLNATSFAWLIIDQANNSRGRFQGTATVTVDGTTTTNVFTVEGIDGDRLSPTTDDRLLLRIYPLGANPDTATPLYQASGSLTKGNAIRIR